MGAARGGARGLLGRRVAGERVGLIAALIAAIHPTLWTWTGSVRSESLYAPLIALALLSAYGSPSALGARTAALLGAAIGLAALTRSEALTLLVLLLLLLSLPARARGGWPRRRLPRCACS